MLLGGCTADGSVAASGAAPSPLPCRPDAAPAADQTGSLRSSGTPPLAPLRYRPDPGHQVRSTVSQSVVITTPEGTSRVDARVPYTVTVRAVCGPVFTMDTQYERPVVDAAGRDGPALRQRMDLLAGLTVREARDARGRVVSTTRAAPAGGDAAAQEALDQILGQLALSSSVFPEDPVGPNARWDSTQAQTVSGLSLTSHAEYTLLERTGTQATLSLRLEITAEPQTVDFGGRTVGVELYQGTGTGTLRVDLTGATATSGEVTVRLRQRLRVGETSTEQSLSQTVAVAPR